MAAVEKIEDQRKPEDFFGNRNRITPYGVRRFRAHTWVRPYGFYEGTDCHGAAGGSSSQ